MIIVVVELFHTPFRDDTTTVGLEILVITTITKVITIHELTFMMESSLFSRVVGLALATLLCTGGFAMTKIQQDTGYVFSTKYGRSFNCRTG